MHHHAQNFYLGFGASTYSYEGKAFYWPEVRTLWEMGSLKGQGSTYFERTERGHFGCANHPYQLCDVSSHHRLHKGLTWSWTWVQIHLLTPSSPEVFVIVAKDSLASLFPDTHPIPWGVIVTKDSLICPFPRYSLIHSAWSIRFNTRELFKLEFVYMYLIFYIWISLIPVKLADSIANWICVS